MDIKKLKVEVEVEITNLNELKEMLQKATDLIEQIEKFNLEIRNQAFVQHNLEQPQH